MKLFLVASSFLFGALIPYATQAQIYPAKTIQILLPLQAGSAGDVAVRVVAQKISENVKQQIFKKMLF